MDRILQGSFERFCKDVVHLVNDFLNVLLVEHSFIMFICRGQELAAYEFFQ
jgi:hypothetical protein